MRAHVYQTLILVVPCLMAAGNGRASFMDDKAPKKAEPIYQFEGHQVVCRDAANQIVWSVALEGRLDGVRPPHLLFDTDAVYVSQGDGVTALDANTGKTLWHSAGPNERMKLTKELLLATRCGYSKVIEREGRCMTARSVKSGKEVFRVRLPADFEDPEPIEERAGFFLIKYARPFWKGKSLLIDERGQEGMHWDHLIVDAVRQAEDLILLSGEQITRVTLDKKIKWDAPLKEPASGFNGAILRLPDGDILVYQYHSIADSGVELTRLDPEEGKKKWRTFCRQLGVDHSQYLHKVNVTLEHGRLKVVSRGSYGDFVELIDPEMGKQIQRKEYMNDKDRLP